MTKTVKIFKHPNIVIASFDTRMVGDKDNPFTGRRVKHRIYKDENVPGCYWHECTFLSEFDEPEEEYTRFISERVFFGKYRLVKERVIYHKETWQIISEVISRMERVK